MAARKLSLTIALCAVALTLALCACNASDTVGTDNADCADAVASYASDADILAKGEFTDMRDCRTYRAVKIGELIWMAENLNYKTMNGKGSWCFAQDDAARIGELDCETYGRFYNWVTAMAIDPMYTAWNFSGADADHQGVCPDGWRLPNHRDWDDLAEATGDPETAGMMLKAVVKEQSWYGAATDEFGFSALPAGYRDRTGWFYHLRYYAYWWTATQYDYTNALHRSVDYKSDGVNSGWNRNKEHGFSVRCVKN